MLPGSVEPVPAPVPLDLRDFRPLLAAPALHSVRDAVESDKPAQAAALLHKQLLVQAPDTPNKAAWHFLLARLLERSEQIEEAGVQFQASALLGGPLAPYASLGAGRMLLRAGFPKLALESLAKIPTDIPPTLPGQLLTAESAAQLGERGRAARALREVLELKLPDSDRRRTELLLAENLLESVSADAGNSVLLVLIVEALKHARHWRLVGHTDKRASEIEKRALALLPVKERVHYRGLSLEDQMVRLRAQVAGRQFSNAAILGESLSTGLRRRDRWGQLGCEATFLRCKALAGTRKWGKASDIFNDVIRFCKEPDLRARSLYLAGKYAAADKRHKLAVKRYAQLEKEAPTHRLADDARLRAAMSYHVMGDVKRFTEMLTAMPNDYPAGDMVLDGMFRLALRNIERGDWKNALPVLERAASLATPLDKARGHEWAGRERYFLARALDQVGKKTEAARLLAEIIEQLPFSYYMQQSHSRLTAAEPARANLARRAGIERAQAETFRFEHDAVFEAPGFQRILELLRVGEIELARTEVSALGLGRELGPKILWGIALLYSQAGSAKLSHRVARGRLSDWFERWPAGDWVQAWRLAFPRPHRGIVTRESQKTGVPEHLIYAVMREESAFEAGAESPARAYGLMQLILPTARFYAKRAGLPSDIAALKKPRINIALGSRVLAHLTKQFRRNPLMAIPGYNAGPGRPRRWMRERGHLAFDVWVETIPFRETRRYTKRVLASRGSYAFLYGEEKSAILPLPLKIQPRK